ncbi:PadR family transcriptional regulator [Paenibacillus sp. CC-CFT747]|nr:PadR family transcriptional regulator [Paenibacillus sp. CC-CFT747]
MNTEMLKGTIDLLLLSVLNKKENYGYEISRTIKERTKGVFEIQEATLYLSLKRLEKQGAVTSYWGSESHGGGASIIPLRMREGSCLTNTHRNGSRR